MHNTALAAQVLCAILSETSLTVVFYQAYDLIAFLDKRKEMAQFTRLFAKIKKAGERMMLWCERYPLKVVFLGRWCDYSAWVHKRYSMLALLGGIRDEGSIMYSTSA